MNTFEFAISSKNVDKEGQATLPAICRCIANAVVRSGNDGVDSMMMSRSAFVIDERPKTGDLINILVSKPLNKNVSTLNKNVKLTDSEGEEIGHGTVEWSKAEELQNGPEYENVGNSTVRFINKFFDLLPGDFASRGLQTGLEIRYSRPVRKNDVLTYKIRRARDDRYVFQALSGGETIFRAALLTA